MAEWKPIRDFNRNYEVVLTQHQEDLYPVPAYRTPSDGEGQFIWLRETEGPEDLFYGAERHCPLYRAPTHYMPLPAPPKETGR